VVGCGAVHLLGSEVALLFYGLIAPEHQRKRIGATLILLRLAQLPASPAGYFVFILAVEASVSTYRRFGFIESGKWTDDDGKQHPAALLRISSATLAKIKSTLIRHCIQLDGTLSLQPSSQRVCMVERTPKGILFQFGNGQPEDHSESPEV
jgi:hypothetical protein